MADYILKSRIDENLWDSCVDSSEQGTVFLTSNFIKSLQTKYKTYLVFQGHEPMGGCVVLEAEDGNYLLSPYVFTPYQGFFFVNREGCKHKIYKKQFEITEFLINNMLQIYKGLSQTHFKILDLRPFSWHNYHTPEKGLFKINVSYTSILNISTYDTLDKYLAAIRKVRRQEYNKAKESDTKIIGSNDVDLFIELYKKTFERQNIKVSDANISLARSIVSCALEKKYGRLQFAMIRDNPASATLFLFDKKRGYYLYGANDPEYRETSAATYLMLENIWRCKEDGLAEVDFVGINSPNRGDYKLSFNGALVPYYTTHLNPERFG